MRSTKRKIITTQLLITAGHGPGELQSLRMNDAHAAHLLPVHHFTEAVLLTSHSTSTFLHQLPSSTTPSTFSDLNSAMVAHRDLRAIRRDDTFPWAIGHGTWPQRQMDNQFVFIAQCWVIKIGSTMTRHSLSSSALTIALWFTVAVVSATLVSASSLDNTGGGVASCRLQETSIRITRDHSDDQGSPVRTCEGTVLVSRCEGTCVSQVQPSITLPHGFLKASSPHFGTSECNCCRETYMNRREIQLQDCFDPNGQKLYGADGSMTIFLEEPQDCSCHKCGG